MLNSLRITLIQNLIELNERFIFYRRLRRYYESVMGKSIQTVIDVGSNRGQTIDFFLGINPKAKVFGFEPNGRLFKQLESKYASNPNIKIFNKGISDEVGEKQFHENVLDFTSSFEDLNMESAYLKRKSTVLGVEPQNIIKQHYAVQVTTLGTFIPEHIHTTIDVLKIDTEGHEYPCLVGLFQQPLAQKIHYIQLEQHNDDMYAHKITFADIQKLLESNGFKPHATIKHGFGNLDEVIFKNVAI